MQFISKEASAVQSSSNALAQLGEEEGYVLGNILIQNIANDAVNADNYLLFSLTTLQIQYEERNIGIGLFGQVFLFDDLEDALKNMEDRRGWESDNIVSETSPAVFAPLTQALRLWFSPLIVTNNLIAFDEQKL